MARFTGERIIPDSNELQYTFARHEVVYRAIAPHVTGLRVVDCGCGEGYGTNLLAGNAKMVTGLDRATHAVREAQQKYSKENISFRPSNFEGALPLGSQSCDAISCCQVIEHIVQAKGLLEEFRRILTSRGWAVLSTPNRNTFSPTGDMLDPYHVCEYSREEFHQLLSRVFPVVRVYALTGNTTVLDYLERDMKTIRRIVRLDILRARRWLPMQIKRWLYDIALNLLRTLQHHAHHPPVSVDDFSITAEHIPDTQILDLIGVVGFDTTQLPNLSNQM